MIDLKTGDCLEKMKDIEDNSVDFILCDPPYELGFMNKKWDNTGIAFNIDLWKEALRVLKPGGYLMAFSGTRTYHRMAVAIEDAGFEVKDMIEWVYASGFPKALDISKAIDKKLGKEREVVGKRTDGRYKYAVNTTLTTYANEVGASAGFSGEKYGIITAPASDLAKQYEGYKTQLKPAHEPICLAMKPLSEKNFAENIMEWGTGGLNIDGSRIGNEKIMLRGGGGGKGTGWGKKEEINETREGRYPANLIIHENIADVLDSQSGYLKSGWKDTDKTDKVGSTYNISNGKSYTGKHYSDKGGASRYFKNIEEEDTYIPFIYHAKASKKDRNIDVNGEQITGELKPKVEGNNGYGIERFNTLPTVNNHATVKPTGLMKYLLKMGLPPVDNAVILDMFAGSGSTGVALEMLNKEEGTNHKCILIEREEEYAEIIKKRCCLK